MEHNHPQCARCPFERQERICQEENGKAPPFCPTVHKATVIEKALEELKKGEVLEFARQASIQEGEGMRTGNSDLRNKTGQTPDS